MKKTALLVALAACFSFSPPAHAQQWTDPQTFRVARPPPERLPCDPGRSLYVQRVVPFNANNAIHLDVMRRAARENNVPLVRGRAVREVLNGLIETVYPAHPADLEVPGRYRNEIMPSDHLSVWIEERGTVPSEQVCHHDDQGNLVPYPGLVPSALLVERSILVSFARYVYGSDFGRAIARFADERSAHARGLLLAMTDVIEAGHAIRRELQRRATIAAGIEERRRAEEVRSRDP